jgi:hypothetical protein
VRVEGGGVPETVACGGAAASHNIVDQEIKKQYLSGHSQIPRKKED